MKDEKEKLRAWVRNREEVGKVMEEIRREEIKKSNLAETIPLFDGAFRSALWLEGAKPYSGLVEFHRILKKLR
ncbi:MAG: hypothetical protein WA584_03445 [Pyrinomonadaceae bacterium]